MSEVARQRSVNDEATEREFREWLRLHAVPVETPAAREKSLAAALAETRAEFEMHDRRKPRWHISEKE